MADIDLKEGQIYLLDGHILVEATLNDNTGMWQLHEPEDPSSWLISPNGKLLGMQFDMARDVWLLEREPDIWTVDDLYAASENTPKLSKLLRQAEQIAGDKHDGHLTLMRLSTGWKAMFGSPDYESDEGRRGVQKLKTFKTLYEAVNSLL